MGITKRITVAAGTGPDGVEWSLIWPVDKWCRLTAAERVRIISNQQALLERGSDEWTNKTQRIKRGPGIGRGDHRPGDH